MSCFRDIVNFTRPLSQRIRKNSDIQPKDGSSVYTLSTKIEPLPSSTLSPLRTNHQKTKHIVIPNDDEKDETKAEDQILLKYNYFLLTNIKLGCGRYSKVYQGMETITGKDIAIKIIDKKRIPSEFKKKFLDREIRLWRKLNHPNILQLFYIHENAEKIFLPSELAESDLLTCIQKQGAQSERRALRWMNNLLSAINYMHNLSIAHRDLKLENILLFHDDTVKIADFGFCRELKKDERSYTFCGSKAYSPPEILQSEPYTPFKADIWSLGVVAYALVTNRMPYKPWGRNDQIVAAQRLRRYIYDPNLFLTKKCRNSIDEMMTFDPKLRPTIQEVMKLPWFQT